MSRAPFKTCPDCGTVLWPVRGLGRVCPHCDALTVWPSIMASYRPGPWTVERDPDCGDAWAPCPDCGEDIARNDPHAPDCPRVWHPAGHPDTELQRDVDSFLRGGPYDWEADGL